MISRTMQPAQTMRLNIQGAPEGVPTWTLSDLALASVEVSADGRSAKIRALAAGLLRVTAAVAPGEVLVADVRIAAGLAPVIEDTTDGELESEHPQG